MINTSENLIPIRDVTKRVPISMATVYRYLERGLDSIRIGGRRYTSQQAIDRFIRQQNPEREQVVAGRSATDRHIDRALDAAGVV
jgi:hypothetical protein